MKKKSKDLKKGDVFRTEFGVKDNFVTVQMLEDTIIKKNTYEHRVVYYKNATQVPFSMFSNDGEEQVELVEVGINHYGRDELEIGIDLASSESKTLTLIVVGGRQPSYIKIKKVLFKMGYKFDEEIQGYYKDIYSKTMKGMFVPFVRNCTIVLTDDKKILLGWNNYYGAKHDSQKCVDNEIAILKGLGYSYDESKI